MKKLAIAVVFLLGVTLTAQAAEFLAPQGKDSNVSTQSAEAHKNLYIAGASITINSATNGDLYAAGGMVNVNANVEKDLTVAGGNLNINGAVGDDARITGGNITINSPIGSDLLVGGGNVSIGEKATIGGDLVAGAGNLDLGSAVAGYAKIAGGNITINGKITGTLEVTASKGLTFGTHAEVLGKITYSGPTEAVIKDGAKVSTIEYTKTENRHNAAGAARAFFAIATLVKLIALLIAGYVLYWLFPRKLEAVLAHSHNSPLKNFGIGFLVLVVSPIAALLLCITVLGFYLGMILFLLYGLILTLTTIFTLFYVGNLAYGWYNKSAIPDLKRDLVIGAIIMLIIYFIPFIGWLVGGVAYLITLGSFVTHLREDHLTHR